MMRAHHVARLAQGLSQEHDTIKAQFDRFRHADAGIRATQKTLDKLSRLGASITQDDVIDAAGKHVAAGFMSAPQMAQFLSSMPISDGAQLASWVEQQDAKVRQMAEQFGPKLEMARHAYANSAMRLLNAGHMMSQPEGQEAALGPAQAPGAAQGPSGLAAPQAPGAS